MENRKVFDWKNGNELLGYDSRRSGILNYSEELSSWQKYKRFKEVMIEESDYLNRLQLLKRPARKLYYYGAIPKVPGRGLKSERFPKEKRGRPKTVAIVGARKMTAYGELYAFKIAKELAELGIIIVSGMAAGIDSAAHRGALAAYYERLDRKLDNDNCSNEIISDEVEKNAPPTIAFLGTPIDRIYPAKNYQLFREVIDAGGAVFSEYAPGEDIYPKTSFLERNRLISGVADAVIVVEADEHSGSLNTAAHAMEQGVPLFAVPGDLSRQMSRGCNQLFGKGVAAYTRVEDVLNVLFPGGVRHRAKQKAKSLELSDDEKIVFDLLSSGVNSGEEIIAEANRGDSEFDASRFNIAITTLELKGLAKREFGNSWILA